MIVSVLDKGLEELFLRGRSRFVPPQLVKRCLVRLDALNRATDLSQLNLPGFDFHPLQGKPQRYSIHINGPWAITFEWLAPNAHRVKLEQYH